MIDVNILAIKIVCYSLAMVSATVAIRCIVELVRLANKPPSIKPEEKGEE